MMHRRTISARSFAIRDQRWLHYRIKDRAEAVNDQKFGVSTVFGAGGGAGSQAPLAP